MLRIIGEIREVNSTLALEIMKTKKRVQDDYNEKKKWWEYGIKSFFPSRQREYFHSAELWVTGKYRLIYFPNPSEYYVVEEYR